MKQIELIEKRKPREKHFLKENGEMVAEVYDEDIHYLSNGEYREINNTLVKNRNCYVNKSNDFKTYFGEKTEQLLKVVSSKNKIEIDLIDKKEVAPKRIKSNNKLFSGIRYEDILDDIDIEYKIMPSKIKEDIILKSINAINNDIVFKIKTNLNLEVDSNGLINVYKDNRKYFTFEKPYMIDSNGIVNNNASYEFIKNDDYYELRLVIDKEWLKSSDIKYPVVIDPTITNSGQNNSVYDTYIYPGDTNDIRYNKDILKVGVERINGVDRVNRALLKFDLPTIGTGDQIVNATLNFVGYAIDNDSYTDSKILNVHQVTEDWTESGANWNNMNDKFNSRIENCFWSERSKLSNSVITPEVCSCDMTNIVKHWYSDTPNYGIMIKLNNEEYTSECLPSFYSKNNSITGDNPKPVLTISYRNQNGIEDYMNYESQQLSKGVVYQNTYNGNMTAIYFVGGTIGSSFPANLSLIYNTNDVILENDYGCGIGCKFSLYQTIEEILLENVIYLKYMDIDGTIHYFKEDNNIYFDEDGLGLKIEKISNKYIMHDKENNKMTFVIRNNIGFLEEIIDLSKNKITIVYNEENKISKIIDSSNNFIEVLYEDNLISIISPDETIYLNYEDGKLTSITTITGISCFAYNDNNLLSGIIDESGISFSYDYYEQKPYRIKRVLELGIDETIGKFIEMRYGFNITKIIDNSFRPKVITFNSFGNAISIIDLEKHNSINGAYGVKENYSKNSSEKNKVETNFLPEKHVNNYLINSNFVKDIMYFTSDDTTIEIVDNMSYSGNRCMKISNEGINQISKHIPLPLPREKNYTFSCYLKNTNDVKLVMYYTNQFDEKIIVESDVIKPKLNFERENITIYYPDYNNATSNLNIEIVSLTPGTLYIDNIQLEEGEVANVYNYVENSNFFYGFTEWTFGLTTLDADSSEENDPDIDDVFELVSIEPNLNAIKVNMNPKNTTELMQKFGIDGKAGDTYNISFWYKSLGVCPSNQLENNYAKLSFVYDNRDIEEDDIFIEQLNSDCTEWQYYTASFCAKADFSNIKMTICQTFNANEFYITNIGVYKDVRTINYNYADGKIISINGLNNLNDTLSYDTNNQIIKTTNPLGKGFVYEYDNLIKDKVLCGISESGICVKTFYDEKENIVATKTTNYNQNNEIDEKNYYIRIKGTNKFLKNINNLIHVSSEDCNHNKWKIEKVGECFRIRHSIINDKFLSVQDDKVVLSDVLDEKSLFYLIKNNNGSYLMKQKLEDKYVKYDTTIVIKELEDDSSSFEFFFEDACDKIFLEKNSEYTENGKFLTKFIDENLNEMVYEIDELTGLKKAETNAKGITTKYTYDDNNKLIKIGCMNREIEYKYNDNNMIEGIICNNKRYKLDYDSFLNIKSIKIGDDKTLITNNYQECNGKLESSIYGNNNQISYDYDDFDRLKSLAKMDDVYNYKYGNNGELLKIVSNNNNITEFTYTSDQNLSKYKYNNFVIKYQYDGNDNIINKNYILDNNYYAIYNEYNEDDIISKLNFENCVINYNYDKLGRLYNKSINGHYNINYDYVINGNRTTLLINSITVCSDIYKYKYDKMNNITHIYCNGVLTNKFFYDDINELIKENDYKKNITIKYKYDLSGNILSKKVLNLNDLSFVSENKYEYNNSWKDQLTKFNDEIITYDQIGNPLNIGTTNLSWINGRELSSYENENIISNYKYDINGTRISKNVNGVETKYFLEDGEIILEKTNDNMLYYIRDDMGNLEAVKYNNALYYYVKNLQNDIIYILDSEYNKVAEYEYDSFGNIVKITDNDGSIITDETHIANINPYRYRSYYYDKETGLYYLNSRYYNPLWGRFINADGYIGTCQGVLGYNMYAYCCNNFVNGIDNNGTFLKKLATKIKNAVSKVVTAVKNLVAKKNKKSTPKKTSSTPVKTKKTKVRIISESGRGCGTGINIGLGVSVKNKNKNNSAKKKSKIKGKFGVGGASYANVFTGNSNLTKYEGYQQVTTFSIGPITYTDMYRRECLYTNENENICTWGDPIEEKGWSFSLPTDLFDINIDENSVFIGVEWDIYLGEEDIDEGNGVSGKLGIEIYR